jgi:hypothetical protein
LDKLTFISQQNARAVQRSLRVTEGSGEKNEVVAVPNTLIGLDSSNQPKALTLSEVKTYLALSGVTLDVNAGMKTFADAGERALAVPEFTGQLGTQRDTADIYISTGTTAGDWADFSLSLDNIPSALITSAKLAYDGGPMSGFRNAIINGNFDIWQRGTSFAAAGYGSDRWYNGRVGSTCTMSRQPFALGQTEVPNEPTYFCRMTVASSAGVGNYVTLQHLIEDVRTFAGQGVTVSFYARADSAKPISVELRQQFGTGGSPSSGVNAIGTTKTTLSSSWQKVTVTATIPSISGKTIGTDNNNRLGLYIWLDAGSNFNSSTDTLGQQSGTFDIAQVQIEAGSVATPFERRPIGTELALCQRYYQSTSGNSVVFDGTNFSNVQFKTTMRANPTIVVTPFIGTISNTTLDVYGFHAQNTTTSNASFTASAEL